MIKRIEELNIKAVSESLRTKSERRTSFNGMYEVHITPSRIHFSNEMVDNNNISDVPIISFNDQTMKEFSKSEEFWKDKHTMQTEVISHLSFL